jgi:NAD(P)H-dependent FMN reductase
MEGAKKVAVITCSSRSPRVNPYVSKYVKDVMESVGRQDISVHHVDLKTYELSIYSEPVIPAQLPADNPTPHYAFESTRNWSQEISKYDGVVFVTPQYNWSIPSGLKNGIDHLFYEWKGKVAGIVSYGGRGGDKAANHLRDILTGIKMNQVDTTPAISLSRNTLEDAEKLGKITDEQVKKWKEAGVEDAVIEMTNQINLKLFKDHE